MRTRTFVLASILIIVNASTLLPMRAEAASVSGISATGGSVWRAYVETVNDALRSAIDLVTNAFYSTSMIGRKPTAALDSQNTAKSLSELPTEGTAPSSAEQPIVTSAATQNASTERPISAAILAGTTAASTISQITSPAITIIVTGIPRAEFDERLAALDAKLGSELYGRPDRPTSGALSRAIAYTNYSVANSTGAALNTVTVNGVTGLTDADIPDGITAAHYLPLSGSAVTGTTTFAGPVGIGSTTPSSQLTLEGWKVNGSGGTPTGGNPQFQINGTLDATGESTRVLGAQWEWATVGATTANVSGLRINLNSGYTGSGITRAGDFKNLVGGRHAFSGVDENGNIGVTAAAQGGYSDDSTTGDNIGLYAIGGGSQNFDIGVYGRAADNAATTSSSIVTVGVAAQSGTTNPIYWSNLRASIGGAFSIGAVVSQPSWYSNPESSVLLLDSQTSGSPLLIGRVNGTNALTLTATGGITSTSTTDSTTFWKVLNSFGSPLLNLDTTNLRVGIGTTTPEGNLVVSNPSGTATLGLISAGNSVGSGNIRFDLRNGDGNQYAFQFSGSGNTILKLQYNGSTKGVISSTGQLSLGTNASTPINILNVAGAAAIGSSYYTNSAPADGLLVQGNVGIATTSPWRTLSVTGTVGFDGLTGATGAGSLCLDNNKQVVHNAGSDACLPSLRSTKHDISALDVAGTMTIAQLTPVSFIYNDDASSTVRYGFIAEDAAAVNPHLATRDAAGKLSGIDDRGLLAVIVKALQELIADVRQLATNVASLADRFTTRELCLGETCITEADLKQLLEERASREQGGIAPVPSPAAPATPGEPSATTSSTPEAEGDASAAPGDEPDEPIAAAPEPGQNASTPAESASEPQDAADAASTPDSTNSASEATEASAKPADAPAGPSTAQEVAEPSSAGVNVVAKN